MSIYDVKSYAIGDLIVITDGEYSDYRVVGVARALRPFMRSDAYGAYKKAHLDRGDNFIRWATNAGLVESVNFKLFDADFEPEHYERWLNSLRAEHTERRGL